MLHIKETIIVEGKFDKERVKCVCDASVICTDGFQVFKSRDLLNSIKHLAKTNGIIILTDSDAAGFKIRNYLKTCIGNLNNVKHAYIPSVTGKERRKAKPGKEGILGVEGMESDTLFEVLKKFAVSDNNSRSTPQITKAELYSDGLSGKEDSFEKRKAVLNYLNLPLRLSPNAMIDVINKTGMYHNYKDAINKISQGELI